MANAKENIAYLSDLEGVTLSPSHVTKGNIASFGDGNSIVDSGKSPSDFVSEETLNATVNNVTNKIFDSITNEDTVAAYKAAEWNPIKQYLLGNYCQKDDVGYKCVVDNSKIGTFNSSDWDVVLTKSGRIAIDNLLSGNSSGGFAELDNLAPSFQDDRKYFIGQLAIKNKKLQICTSSGRGEAAKFSDDNASIYDAIDYQVRTLLSYIAPEYSDEESYSVGQLVLKSNDSGSGETILQVCTVAGDGMDAEFKSGAVVDKAIALRIESLKIPKAVSELENDEHFVKSDSVVKEFNPEQSEYKEGDVCFYNGKFYKCRHSISKSGPWNTYYWEEYSFYELISSSINAQSSKVTDAYTEADAAIAEKVTKEYTEADTAIAEKVTKEYTEADTAIAEKVTKEYTEADKKVAAKIFNIGDYEQISISGPKDYTVFNKHINYITINDYDYSSFTTATINNKNYNTLLDINVLIQDQAEDRTDLYLSIYSDFDIKCNFSNFVVAYTTLFSNQSYNATYEYKLLSVGKSLVHLIKTDKKDKENKPIYYIEVVAANEYGIDYNCLNLVAPAIDKTKEYKAGQLVRNGDGLLYARDNDFIEVQSISEMFEFWRDYWTQKIQDSSGGGSGDSGGTSSQTQVDWAVIDPNNVAYIKNKPDVLTNYGIDAYMSYVEDGVQDFKLLLNREQQVGNFVSVDQNIYRCVSGNTPNSEADITNAPSAWQLVLTSEWKTKLNNTFAYCVDDIKYNSGQKYTYGTFCLYNGSFYRCIVDSSKAAPAVLDSEGNVSSINSGWEKSSFYEATVRPYILKGAALAEEFSEDKEYKEGDFCTYNGILYQCIKPIPQNKNDTSFNGYYFECWKRITATDFFASNQADWTETNESSGSFIKNKGDVIASETLSIYGQNNFPLTFREDNKNTDSFSFDLWKRNTVYYKDDVRTYSGQIYKCITNHTSGDEFDDIYWTISLSSTVSNNIARLLMPFVQVGDIVKSYSSGLLGSVKKGDIVCFNTIDSGTNGSFKHSFYKAKSDAPAYGPPNTSYWETISFVDVLKEKLNISVSGTIPTVLVDIDKAEESGKETQAASAYAVKTKLASISDALDKILQYGGNDGSTIYADTILLTSDAGLQYEINIKFDSSESENVIEIGQTPITESDSNGVSFAALYLLDDYMNAHKVTLVTATDGNSDEKSISVEQTTSSGVSPTTLYLKGSDGLYYNVMLITDEAGEKNIGISKVGVIKKE